MNDIKELLNQLEQAYKDPRCIDREKAQRYYNAVTDLQQENNQQKYIIDEIEKWLTDRQINDSTLDEWTIIEVRNKFAELRGKNNGKN